MKTLAIYDESGFIINQMQGSDLREPVGIPFIWIEIPQGKILKSINVSGTKHKPVYEDLLKSETQKLQELIDQLIIDNLNMQQQIDTLTVSNVEV